MNLATRDRGCGFALALQSLLNYGVEMHRLAMNHSLPMAALVALLSVQASAQSTDTSLVRRYEEEGQRALAEGRYPEAESAYEKLREMEPGIAEVRANLGLIYFEERKFELAVKELRGALKLKPGLTKTEALLSMALSEVGQYKEAVRGLEKGFHHSTDPELRRMSGLQLQRAYANLGQNSESVEVGLELARLFPDDAEVLYCNGKIFGNYAFLSMKKLSEIAPDSIWRRQSAAEAFQAQGSYDAAIAGYRSVLELDHRRPGIHYRWGQALLSRSRQTGSADDLAQALIEFQQELRIDPSNANAAYELGEAYRRSARMEDAQRFFERAIMYYPDFEEALVGLGSIFLEVNKPELALTHLQKAVILDPRDEVAWYRLARAQKLLGNVALQQKALAEFQRLHQKALQQAGVKEPKSPSEVSKQAIEPSAEP
jgi:tetratricopeptide (TPR) repeat protein